jgi:hypothetical protein
MFAVSLKPVREFLLRVRHSLKKQPSAGAVVDEHIHDIPDNQIPRIKRHLQEHRAAREGGEQGIAARLFGDLCALKRFFHTCKGTIA